MFLRAKRALPLGDQPRCYDVMTCQFFIIWLNVSENMCCLFISQITLFFFFLSSVTSSLKSSELVPAYCIWTCTVGMEDSSNYWTTTVYVAWAPYQNTASILFGVVCFGSRAALGHIGYFRKWTFLLQESNFTTLETFFLSSAKILISQCFASCFKPSAFTFLSQYFRF